MNDKPFLMGIGFNKRLFAFEPTLTNLLFIYKHIKDIQFFFAHNTKFDYHMLINNGTPIPKELTLADGMTVARLTSFADFIGGIGLDDLGVRYVDPTAKFGAQIIHEHIKRINKERLKVLKDKLKAEKLPCKLQELVDAYKNRVQFVETALDPWFKFIDDNFKEANYRDVWIEEPELMKMYMLDDLVILLEYLNKALPALNKHYGELPKVFYQECELIRVVGDFERNGIRADIQYLLDSRLRVKAYIDDTYKKLWELSGFKFSSGQHKVIMQMFKDKYDVIMENCDAQALDKTIKNEHISEEAKQIAKYIVELRTLDKWLSTYIEGMLNRVQNGRIHTSINNSGAVTGRVSSDMQQQPKEPLTTRDGEELFHPRRVFINDDGHRTFYFDFSQMELRLQAEYTLMVSGGDLNLCRAYIPLKCKSMFTGEEFVVGEDDWDSGEWIDENGQLWSKTDLHAETALKAFPDIARDSPDFPHYRSLGKVANFLKVYAGGVQAIIDQLGVSEEIARALDKGFYKAFPQVKNYQYWVDSTLTKQGYVENLFGRRYYISSPQFYYKTYNYLIQGGCADILKEKEVKVAKLLEGTDSKMLLPVHDELQISIKYGEEYLVPKIVEIMNESNLKIPMICDVEYTTSSWADKKDWEGDEGE